jgi:UDP-N-acetylglucosamine--N-acetylmuramyl-(pentapeptide) pyrophosphoryl-undecaprenol N-acetylglucosamine transferase
MHDVLKHTTRIPAHDRRRRRHRRALFPGIAVAQAFLAGNPCNQVLFVNAGRPLEVNVLTRLGWPHRNHSNRRHQGRGIWNQAQGHAQDSPGDLALAGSSGIFRPTWSWGRWVFGRSGGSGGMAPGYPDGPARTESGPGLTNRLLRRVVDRIYLTFAGPTGRLPMPQNPG